MASVLRFGLALLHVCYLFICHASAQSELSAIASGMLDRSASGVMDISDCQSSAATEECRPRCQNLTEMMFENGKNFSEYCGNQENRKGFFASPAQSRILGLALNITVVNTIIRTGLNSDRCGDLIQQLLCRYIFPPCDDDSLPEAPCDEFCTGIVLQSCGSEWRTLWSLLREIDNIVNSSVVNGVPSSSNPLTFLMDVIPAADCRNLFYYNNTYSNSCNCMGRAVAQGSCSGVSLGLQNYVVLAAVLGSVLVVVELVVIVVVLLCWWKRQRRRKEEQGLRVYPYSSSYNNWRTTLPGWPFVHPRNSRFKSKGELYHQAPESYMEILADHMDYLIQFSRIHTTIYLAEGRYSEVYQGYVVDLQPHQTQTYRNVVIKRFKEHVRDIDIMDYLEMSLKICSVNHPNVLHLIGMGFDPTGSVSLVYPYLVEHDLLTFLKKKRSNDFSSNPSNDLGVGKLVDIVMQIGLGMRAITEMGITYKMLSAHTCMCDLGPHVAIGDVSMCQQMGQLREEEDYHRWVAPEGIREKQFTEKSDVWSYGVTCWEVFSLGRHPYEEVGNSELMTHVAHGNRLERPPLCPPSVFSIMEQCWFHEPQHRPSFAELVSSLSGIMRSSKYQREVEGVEAQEEETSGPDRLAVAAFERRQQTASHALVSATMSAPVQGAAGRNDVGHQCTPAAIVIPGVALTATSEKKQSSSASPDGIMETAFNGDHERSVRWSQLERISRDSSPEESIYAEVERQRKTSNNSCEETGKPFSSSEIKESKECEQSGEYENQGLVPSTIKCSLEPMPVQDKVYYNLPQYYLSTMPESSSVLRTMVHESGKKNPSPPPVFKKPKVLPRLSKNSENDNSQATNSGLGV